MQRSPETRVGVAWYNEPDRHKLRAIAADPDQLEPPYIDWLRVVNKGLRTLTEAGVTAELQAWCEQERRAVDSAVRSESAALVLRRRYQPGSTGSSTSG